MSSHHKKPLRLKGYDYSHAGRYFVTFCTIDRICILGRIREGKMELSALGQIVEDCWKEIPKHFQNVRIGKFQVMPDHIHGIIEILESDGSHSQVNDWILMRQEGVSLGKVVRSFKAHSTRMIRKAGNSNFAWESLYHDWIIRNESHHRAICRYIRLNPLLWYLDSRDSPAHDISPEELGRTLDRDKEISESDIRYLLNHVSRSRAKRKMKRTNL